MTYPADPYRYGPPAPVQTGKPTGKLVLRACWAMLRQDRGMLVLPMIATLASLVAAGILFVPGFFVGNALSSSGDTRWYVAGVLASFGASAVGIYFQAALVIGANQRADGQTPTLRGVLSAAWQMRGRIFSWALVTTTVGLAIRALEERLGIFGRVLGLVAGLTWAVASYLVVPVLVVEGLGPIAAVKRSGGLIKDVWGTGLRTTLRFGLIQLAITLPLLIVTVVGVAMVATGSSAGIAIGITLLFVGVVGLIAALSVFGAVSNYAQAMIYRYATGRPVPGIAPELMGGVFAPRRGRRR